MHDRRRWIRTLGLAQGAANTVGGLWPLVHMRSFEGVFGPKTDRWLVQTVAGLLLSNGLCQLLAASSPGGEPYARHIGMGTAGTLATIDLVHVSAGRISKMYLADAAVELGWLTLWTCGPMVAARREASGRALAH